MSDSEAEGGASLGASLAQEADRGDQAQAAPIVGGGAFLYERPWDYDQDVYSDYDGNDDDEEPEHDRDYEMERQNAEPDVPDQHHADDSDSMDDMIVDGEDGQGREVYSEDEDEYQSEDGDDEDEDDVEEDEADEEAPRDHRPIPPANAMPTNLSLPHPSNSNPNVLGPATHRTLDLVNFLYAWSTLPASSHPPNRAKALLQFRNPLRSLVYDDLKADRCDLQGLDWKDMGTSREMARQIRKRAYYNYVNRTGSDDWSKRPAGKELPCDESFFRFTKMSFLSDVSLAHFQLRNVFACPSRAQFIYASHGDVKVLDPISHKTRIAVNSRRFSDNGTIISALDADCGVLVAGSLHGQYCVQPLGSEGPEFHQGRITYSINGFTNHVKLHLPRRSSTPVAAIASNDEFLRLLNVETRQFVLQKKYPYALNCSAASPDRQLRVVVGDSPDIAITDTATGNILHQFSGHDDHCFACDWSDDGWAVATSAQDRSIKVWDARRWCNTRGESEPVHTILTEMAGARNLKFSPAGGGRKVLVATEASDYVNIIDATTYQSKQTFDLFGEMGNAAFISEGYGLTVLCTDPARGGALQLERCGRGIDFWDEDDIDIAPSDPSRLYGGPFRKPPRQSSRFELMAPF